MTNFARKKRTLIEISQITGPLTLFSVPMESPWWIQLHQGDFIMADLWCGSYWNSNILCMNIEYKFYKTAFQPKWTFTHIHILWRTRLQYVLYEGQIPTNHQSGYIYIYIYIYSLFVCVAIFQMHTHPPTSLSWCTKCKWCGVSHAFEPAKICHGSQHYCFEWLIVADDVLQAPFLSFFCGYICDVQREWKEMDRYIVCVCCNWGWEMVGWQVGGLVGGARWF